MNPLHLTSDYVCYGITPFNHLNGSKWIKESNGFKIKIDEKKDEQNLFTTDNYVSIQTLPFHN
jgi:hypothetical protein